MEPDRISNYKPATISRSANGANVSVTVAAFGSLARATRKAALSMFSVALLLAGGAAAARGQSALDGFDPNANGVVRVIVVQPDGKILIGGDFTTVVGVTRNHLARLNPDGALDASFDPNVTSNFTVVTIAVQSDGKILIGGQFTTLAPNGGAAVTRNNIARLATNGTVDTSFDPNTNDEVNTIAVQADGKILIGGFFTTLAPNGGAAVTSNRIARLNTDGTLDAAFNPNVNNTGPTHNRTVVSIAVQSDGKILIGGQFTTLSPNDGATVTRNNIARLNTDGTVDASFDPNANGLVNSIAVQQDGEILIVGGFTSLAPNGGAAVTRSYIARLNTNGTVDALFDPNVHGGPGDIVSSVVVQQNGKILIAGRFASLSPNGGAAVTRNGFARLNTDGTVDTSFDPNPNGVVVSIAVQQDGKILVGGQFTTFAPSGGAAVTRNDIARLNGTPTALAQLANISTRLSVGSGDNVLIGGFIITGPSGSTKKVMLRGIGPSLSVNGAPIPGRISDPLLELHEPDGTTITNDNWADAPNKGEIPNGFQPTDIRESVVITTLAPGAYTVILKGAHGETGVALVEAYDLDQASSAQLANISTRGFIQTADNVMIGGFIVTGPAGSTKKVMLRGMGPSLSVNGAPIAGRITDPLLELHEPDGTVITNDNWADGANTGDIPNGFQPGDSRESVIITTLAPGGYTVVLKGAHGETGVGLVEAYQLN